ncbi:ATP-dependent 6-phosphofructokinase [Oceanispirochaeta sp.]|jgi:6-phosphofructokinase 1|uniref:ATP-dependent 6-phosphofructokinase n=1 Tax=Oceanispirochaeta sp. TaxID=2035350 RepID=UPI0026162F27|nr:ATP-dependent 6-phosphofructokinase [Oceanispirochaeta sp.]MDA3957069.1 ATP-dependent 6-phosphofructokinase [Oceanispirochaeta sp.]
MKPMQYRIESLGECRVESPLPSLVAGAKEEARILQDATLRELPADASEPASLELSGPMSKLYFDPKNTRAAIITCGGLCPGLNDVIRAVTMVLWYRYGVRDILGLRYGFEGLNPDLGHAPVRLEPELVEDIHQQGGTILGTSRGKQDEKQMVDFLQENRIDILLAVGGDGTQRGALDLADEIDRRGAKIAVVGIPKTIDNDISCTERTFGFQTAVALSQPSIDSAHMEAKGVRNGIGLVKLMGRDSGFIAAYASLASSDVNLLLVPEVPFSLPKVMGFLEKRLEQKSHAVIVVAEGAGINLVPTGGTDASGNLKRGDIGIFLKEAIKNHFQQIGRGVSVKYIDPSYTIRSARANADDSVFCFRLAENAVHAAMAGKTRLVVGLWNGHFVNIPSTEVVRHRKHIDSAGPLWASILSNTGQPNLA